jgi:anti-anti-sigma factor
MGAECRASAEGPAVDAGDIRVSTEVSDHACVIEVSGELTFTTEPEFTVRVTQAVAASRGLVLFDLSGLDFLDCRGARALARAVHAVPSRETGVRGCNPAVRHVLDALGFDLPYRPEPAGPVPLRPRPGALAGTSSRGEALSAMTRAASSSTRESALYASEVLSRLAATYSELALNSRYRAPRKSEDRGRLLALSGRALDLSRRYMRNAANEAAAAGP